MSTSTQVTYLYDPLCGWCYGAMAKFSLLAQAPTVHLRLAPTGLFQGTGARTMDEKFAAYAWASDQRIAALTAQRFSLAYRDKVLGAHGARFDSGPATMALTAVAITSPERELEVLQAIQASRYVYGRDVTSLAVLADVLTRLDLNNVGIRILSPDKELLGATDARIAAAQRDMQAFGARGVPTLLVGTGPHRRLRDSSALFDDKIDVVTEFTSILPPRVVPASRAYSFCH
jgi:putative protein-disulfide isomerase